MIGRIIVFTLTVCVFLIILFTENSTYSKLQYFALTSLLPLFGALFIWPITSYFSKKLFNNLTVIQESLVASALFFGLVHGVLAFQTQLGGLQGLSFLTWDYILAVGLSSFAIIVFLVFMFRRVSAISHAGLYIAGLSIVIHANMLGTHFKLISYTIPQVIFYTTVILLVLIALRVDALLLKKYGLNRLFGISTLIVLIATGFMYVVYILPGQTYSEADLSIHAQRAQENDQANENYGVSFERPETIKVGESTRLVFSVTNENNGEPVLLFEQLTKKTPRLFIVDENFSHTQNIPLQISDSTLSRNDIIFPEAGRYHLYVDYQPFGSQDQMSAFIVEVGDTSSIPIIPQSYESTYEDIDGKYLIRIKNPQAYDSGALFAGSEIMSFEIIDTELSEPQTSINLHMGKYGVLTIINLDTFEYLHSKEATVQTGRRSESLDSGHLVLDYTPSGLYGPIRQGAYKLYAEFSVGTEGKIIVGEFTIHAK